MFHKFCVKYLKNKKLVQNDDYHKNTELNCIGEGDNHSVANTTIETFKSKANEKGGFYIGRFEQGTGNMCKKNIEPYVNVTRDEGKGQSDAMLVVMHGIQH